MKAFSEGKWIFATEALLILVLAKFTTIGLVVAVLLLLFTLYFFRDPAPNVSADPKDIVAPATGKVDVIEETDEPVFRAARSKRVSIFLSVFDIHTQRTPIAGTVKTIQYAPGKFANAISPSCATVNENQLIGIEGEGMRVSVRQIAGLIARRICTWCKEGDALAKGDHLGMIRFGSRVDVFLPADVEVTVKLGDHVRGGETILARIR
jgi:phosphatidylserine decarboxylase